MAIFQQLVDEFVANGHFIILLKVFIKMPFTQIILHSQSPSNRVLAPAVGGLLFRQR